MTLTIYGVLVPVYLRNYNPYYKNLIDIMGIFGFESVAQELLVSSRAQHQPRHYALD